MKECPFSGHPVSEDGRCTKCWMGYTHPERMQQHADWLAKEKGIYLDGWTRKPINPDPESHTVKVRQNEKKKE